MSMLGKGSKTGRTPTPSSQRKISSFFTPKTAIGNDSSSGKSTERKGTSDRPADGVDTEGNEAALMELDAEEGPEVIASALKIPSNGKLAGFRFETSTSSDLRNPLSKSRNADILRQRAARLQLKLNSDSGSTIGESQKRARDDEEEEEKSAKRRPIKIKHTPLELQVIDLKAKHAGVLLVVEVGYKYRFFGDDARVASQELGIVAYQDHNFLTCSVPTHRVNVHVKKLVLLGHKVGIVNQMETAAIKAVGDNKSAPFTRTLTKLYTKGTFIDDVDDESMQGDSQSYLLSISENVVSDAKVKVSLVAMLISTGDVIYDCFDDTLNRDELETRFAHIQPSELLLPVKLSTRTEKVITRYTARRSSNRSECARIERLAIVKDYSKSLQDLTNFYESDVAGKGFTEDLLTKVFALPEGVVVCLASLLSYLKEFGIENAVTKLSFFQTFDSRAQMMLSATTVENLELFRNSTDGRPIGSLLSVIDQTSSKFGKRLFRKWVSRPLIDQTALIRRIDAVEELIKKEADDCIQIHKIRALLRQVPDLERSLTKLYHVKSSPSELLSTLNAFEKVCDSAIPGTKYKSDLLNELIEKLPTVRGHVVAFKMLLNKDAAAANDKILLFAQEEQWPKIIELKEGILRVEGEFIEHLKEIRKTVGDSTLDFTSVSGIDYLIEVKNARTKSVPKQWLKISTTKAVTRFHTPLIATKTKERERYREELRLTCDAAYIELLHDVAEQYDAFRDVSSALANLDCLMSLAAAAQKPGYVRPEFVDGSVMQVKAGRHPVGETHLSNYVPNDIAFDEVKRTLILTGPNMGGKSSYIRQVALIVILAQIGSYVPASSAKLGIFDGVYTRMGASDDITRGQSTFFKEMTEMSQIIKAAGRRSLVIADELGRGTSSWDGAAIAYGTLKYLVTKLEPVTVFVTHYPIIGSLENEFPVKVETKHMDFVEAGDDGRVVAFLYTLKQGLADRSYGLNVAKLAQLPQGILDRAAEKSLEMEVSSVSRRVVKKLQLIKALESEDVNEVKMLVGNAREII